jgi:pimeloyl-ACP methyl ester carboxylesterase
MELIVQGHQTFVYTGGKPFDASLPRAVFVHGGENDHSVWALQSRYFAHHGFAVLAVDLPGHGRSAGPALTSIEASGDWLCALLDATGTTGTTLIGHSMGSLIVLEAAAGRPEQVARLALLGTAFPMRVADELLDATRNDEPRAHAMINLWCHAGFAHYPSSPGPGAWVPGGNLRLLRRQLPGTLFADFDACKRYDHGTTSAAKIVCPTLFVIAARDVMTPSRSARTFAKAFANASIVEIAGCGHNLMGEKPDEVLDALWAFCRKV